MDGSPDNELETTDIYGFGEFLLNPKERRLAFKGSFLDIKPKAFEILAFLVSKSGEVVTKDLVLDAVWEGNFVEEGNLAVHVSKLRKMFDRTGPFNYIQTIPGVGYSFVEPVRKVSDLEWKEAVKDAMPLIDPFAVDDGRESIAIMPLFNENADPELDYLADGLTEALINNLSCRPNLRVIARNTVFRFKNQDIDVKEIGRLLSVTSILTGRIRIMGDDISLSVELSSVSDGTQLWGNRFDRDFSGIFDMQDSITNSICEQLNAELGRSALNTAGNARTINSESYRLFLKAKFFLNKRGSTKDLYRAEELFLNSISLDPAFAASYVGLANCARVQFMYHEIRREEAIEKISQLLSRAYEINPILPEYYLLKGYFEMFFYFNFEKAEASFEKALSLSPASSQARNYLARLLVYQGNTSRGLSMAAESANLDPVSYSNDKGLAKLFLMTSQFQNAVYRLEECLELAPDDFEASVLLGFAKAELGQFDDALRCFETALSTQYHLETVAMQGYTHGLAGNHQKAKRILAKLKKASLDQLVPSSLLALVHAGLGNKKEAIRLLQQTFEENYMDIVSLKVDPRWNCLRNEPDFAELIAKLNI